jgi:hypothetical protein
MLFTKVASATLGLALLALPGAWQGQGGSTPKDSTGKEDALEQKNRAAVEAWVHRIMSSESAKAAPVPVKPSIEPVESAAVRRLFPDERYYAVHFMSYPRAVATPPPLELNNLVRLRPDGSVGRIADLDELKKLWAEKLPPVGDEAHARTAVSGFLPLAVEFLSQHGRGRYTFDIPEDGVTASRQGDALTATGKAIATRGGQGQVTVTLTFDASGKLKPDDIKITTKLRALPGGRPR